MNLFAEGNVTVVNALITHVPIVKSVVGKRGGEGGGHSKEESKLLSGGLGDASLYPAKHLQPNINGGCDFETEGSANML